MEYHDAYDAEHDVQAHDGAACDAAAHHIPVAHAGEHHQRDGGCGDERGQKPARVGFGFEEQQRAGVRAQDQAQLVDEDVAQGDHSRRNRERKREGDAQLPVGAFLIACADRSAADHLRPRGDDVRYRCGDYREGVQKPACCDGSGTEQPCHDHAVDGVSQNGYGGHHQLDQEQPFEDEPDHGRSSDFLDIACGRRGRLRPPVVFADAPSGFRRSSRGEGAPFCPVAGFRRP